MFQVASITKSFKEKAVLKGVSFSIEEGDKIALLGNNGAGKSTLFNIIAGQLQADSGTIKTSLDFQREIGMMPQGDLLIEDLTVAEFVELKSRMNQLKQADINGLLEMVELRESREQMVGSLSGGQKRRLSLLLTILNHPKLIFLDEPTTGMDLEAVDNFWKLLEQQEFTSVVVTHDFNQIDAFFTKVLILKEGRIAATKAVELGAKVIAISGPDGVCEIPEGITKDMIDYMLVMRASNRNQVSMMADKFPGKAIFTPGKKAWSVKCDLALPCAFQNELNGDDAKELIANGTWCCCEVSNMGCTPEAIHEFQSNGILFAPGKAVNAGGVATSGLEMTQNAAHLGWAAEEVDAKLHFIMKSIHEACVKYGTQPDGTIDYVKGANIAGFMKVAQAMLEQGII